MATSSSPALKTIAWSIGIILLLVVFTAILMPTLRSSRMLSFKREIARSTGRDMAAPPMMAPAMEPPSKQDKPAPPPTPAHVKRFIAEIDLKPRKSIGTARPESIYEATFHAQLTAANPLTKAENCEIRLPLPPRLISLADLNVSVNGEPDQPIALAGEHLIWRGMLEPDTPAEIEVTYSAVGKGIYTLAPPSGGIVDIFEITLTVHRSDIRMMKLCLQPDEPTKADGKTVYTWKYERLLFGRPIAVDVLGVAPADRLGELVWLGPVSVLAFGVLAALAVLAFQPDKLNIWMLLLIVGAFAGAYPLMYFAQDFLSLPVAIALAAVVAVGIIAARGVTLFGPALGLLGIAALAAAIGAIILVATLQSDYEGLALTLLAIGSLVVAMSLLPRIQKHLAAEAARSQKPERLPGGAGGDPERPPGESIAPPLPNDA